MKVLVIGGGGREHALAWKLSQAQRVSQVVCTSANPGIAEIATLQVVAPDNYVDLALRVRAGLTVVGPESPLVEGVVDTFRSRHLAIVGPTAAAAQLEGSKAFSKKFLSEHNIPTARFITVTSCAEGRQALKDFSLPVVLKADGLAAGKGVIIARSPEEAEHALNTLLSHRAVVIEEFLTGEELSFIALCDGMRALPLPPSQDHKAAFDNDEGPNTGGMGAYSDSRLLAPAQTREILDKIIHPTLAGMATAGTPFSGFLYAGLMMTTEGPKVLEFNVRLGDPEAQALLHRLHADPFLDALEAAAAGDLGDMTLDVDPDPAICVVLAAHGYPGTVRTGDAITGIEEAEKRGVKVFHAGTRRHGNQLQTAGGRVLGVTASGPTLADARDLVYGAIPCIQFAGMHYRKDIGNKGLRRYNESEWGRSSAG